MDKNVLNVKRRSVIGKKVKVMRREGRIPAVVYGSGIEPIALEANTREATRLLSRISGSTLLELDIEGKKHSVLVRDIQVDVITRVILHIDFIKVAMDMLIKTAVPIVLVGESGAVANFGAIVVPGISTIEVEALPADLPEKVEVDLVALETLDNNLTVADVDMGEKVTVLSEPDEIIASVVVPRMIEEEEEEVEEGEEDLISDEDGPEVIERGKKEEEEDEA